MTLAVDAVDTLGRQAATELHARTRTTDTEAALARLVPPGGAAGRPGRPLRRPGRRVVLVAAAAVVVVTAGIGLVALRDDGRPAGVATVPPLDLDPDAYGPVVASIQGSSSPTLRADLHAPAALDDGTKVAVAVSGGVPGQRYSLLQCASGAEDYNPAADCVSRPPLVVGPDGSGVSVVEVWTVMDGMAVPHRSDCRVVSCELLVSATVDDADLSTADADRGFGTDALPMEGFVLHFADEASAPPLPSITVEAVRSEPDTQVVRIRGMNLSPGPTPVLLDGFPQRSTGMLANMAGLGPVDVGSVDVAADGTVDQEVALPTRITDQSVRETNGVVEEPQVLRCDVAPTRCTVRLGLPETDPKVDPLVHRRLVPEQVPYPLTP